MTTVGEAWVDVKTRLVSGTGAPVGTGGDPELNRQVSQIAESAAQTAAAVFAARKIFDFTGQSLEAARESNRVAAQTTAVIKSTGDAANVTAQEVSDLAKSLSKKTGIDDEAIQTGQNLLLTFTNIRNEAGKGNDIFDQATKLMVDFGAAMGGDASSGAIMLGKALQDPILGITALRRAGIQFSAQQEEQIKQAVEHNNLLRAQKIILAEVERQFGGSAQAQATDADRAAVALDNLKESIGNGLIPVVDTLSRIAIPVFDAFTSAPEPLQAVAVGFAAIAASSVGIAKGIEAFREVREVLTGVTAAVSARVAAQTAETVATTTATAADIAGTEALAAYVGAEAAAAVATTELATAEVAAGTAVAATNPILLAAVAALAAVTAGVLLFTNRKNEQREAIKRVESALIDESGALKTNQDAFDDWLASNSRFEARNQIDDLDRLGLKYADLTALLKDNVDGADAFIDAATRTGEVLEVVKIGADTYIDAQGRLHNSTEGLREVNGRFLVGNVDLIKSFELEAKALQEAARAGAEELVRRGEIEQSALDAAKATNTAANGTVNWVRVNEQLARGLSSATSSVDTFTDSTYATAVAAQTAADAIDGIAEAVFGATDKQRSFEKSLADTEKQSQRASAASDDYERRLRSIEDATQSLTDAEEDLADAQANRLRVSLGASADDITKARIAQEQAERSQARARIALDEAKRAQAEAEANVSPEARLQREKDATDALTRARRAAESAQLDVLEAAAKAGEGTTPEQRRRSELALASAIDRKRQADLAVTEAEKNLTKARTDDHDAALKNINAALDLKDAEDRVTLSVIATGEAHEQLIDTLRRGKEGSQELKDADDQLERATRAVEAAQRALADANRVTRSTTSEVGEAAKDAGERLSDAASAGQAWLQFLINSKAPTGDVLAAVLSIKNGLDGLVEKFPEGASAVEDFYRRAGAAVDSYIMERFRALQEELAASGAGLTDGEVAFALAGLAADAAGLKQKLGIPSREHGGPAAGLTLVGEGGPELVNFRSGAMVHSAPATQRILASAITDASRNAAVTIHAPITVQAVVDSRAQARVIGSDMAAQLSDVVSREIAVLLRGG